MLGSDLKTSNDDKQLFQYVPLLGTRRVAIHLADVVTGLVSRKSASEVIIFVNLGLALEDVSTAQLIYGRAPWCFDRSGQVNRFCTERFWAKAM